MGLVHLLLNPSASGRRRRKREAALRAALRARGHEIVELAPENVAAVAPTVAAARDEGMERLVIVGGDGVVHHALPAVAYTPVVVGIVPIGTGNDFARALGLSSDVDTAVEAALSEPVPLDLIVAEGPTSQQQPALAPGRWAASVVTGGFSSRVTARANALRFPPGQQRYTVATLLEMASLSTVELSLEIDGTTHELESTLFAVGNSSYFGGGMAICPDAVPDDGLLDVTVIGPASRLTFARVLPSVFSGRHVDHPDVTTYRAATVGLSTTGDIWADGEPFVNGPYSAAPGALRMAGSLEPPRRGLE